MKIILDEGARLPTRAHKDDAGLDLYARETKVVPARGSAIFDTGVHIELPKIYIGNGMWADRYCTVGELKSKSGLNVKHNIISDGTIDMGYTGSIVVKLYNLGDEDYTVNAGDKISQIVIKPILTPELEVVEKFSETARGNNGFGSSGK